MATGFRRASAAPQGRQVAAGQLSNAMLSGADACRDWSSTYAPPEVDFTIADLISAAGGTTAFARETGISARQVRRLHREGLSPRARQRTKAAINSAGRRLRQQSYAQAQLGELVQRYGGIEKLAGSVGLTRQTVSSWLHGHSVPSAESLARLQQADRAYRLRATYPEVKFDARTGKPERIVRLYAEGLVHARGPGGSKLYDFVRKIGVESLDRGGHALSAETVSAMFESVRSGESELALDALQQELSSSYASFQDAYDADSGIGFHFQTLTEFQLNVQPDTLF